MKVRSLAVVAGLVVVLVLALQFLGSDTMAYEEVPTVPVIEEPTPAPPPTYDDTDSVEIEMEVGESQLRKVIVDLATPPRPKLNDGEIVGIKPTEGLGVVSAILHSSVTDSFIGRFDASYIAPGSIIDCVPYVRADLGATVRAMEGMTKPTYQVDLYTFVAGSQDVVPRASWEVDAGRQDQQRSAVQSVLSELQNNAGGYEAPVRYRQSARYARTLEEAQARLGLSLQSRFFTADLKSQRESSVDRAVFLGMVQQEFFRLGASPESSEPGPEAWIQDRPENVQILESLKKGKTSWPGVPARISQVRYGRVLIVTFEIELKHESEWLELNAGYRSPSYSVDLDTWNEALSRSRAETIDVIVYGGGALPDQLGVDVSEDESGFQNISVSKQGALDVLKQLVEEGARWSPRNPGAAIGIELTLLGDAGGVLQPFQLTLASLAQHFANQPGWQIVLQGDIKNDFDGGAFGDSGEWKIDLQANGASVIRDDGSRHVTSPTSISRVGTLGGASDWGAQVSATLSITEEDDGFLRGDDDKSGCEFKTVTNTEPEEVKSFWEKAETHSITHEFFRDAFKTARQTENAEDIPSHAAVRKQRQDAMGLMSARFDEMSTSVDGVVQAAESARRALEILAVQGVRSTASDQGNQFTLIAIPDVSGAIEGIDAYVRDLKNWRTTIRAYLDR